MTDAINIFHDFFKGDGDWSKNSITLKEIWKDVKGYDGIYQVSNFGRVKSLKRTVKKVNFTRIVKERILKCFDNSHRYLVVSLYKNGKRKTCKVHKLVAIAFLGHEPCGMELVVNHINFDRQNNNVDNLEIVSQRQNSNQKHLQSTSQFVGVCWSKKSKKWRSTIKIDGKQKYIGLFDCEIEAAESYQKVLKTL